ncbi:U4/U6.U5 tri-snRNP-associated protein 1 isoform X1 [Drosophila subobscura]|uniref:U4/U6.U5 tri-snRNP-associated protein 1 isoform X1 n=1 Tax=Drosophila subobscura TaxID=7241 RepID=UPI00155AEA79|nr:U4/U6.U5 tri-snRNP-associated protein 1 isoform X1 [Drosophila subobscura]
MGSSSSGKKHKKDKKARHRSRSAERQARATEDEDVTLDLTDDSSAGRHRHHKHKKQKEHKDTKEHKEHRHKHHKHKERERASEVISLEESDSDSSDCVEVPVEQTKAKEASAREREREREPEPSVRERAGRERDQQREKERERERDRERERERERERDRNREKERAKDRERERDRERDRDRERERHGELSAPPPPQISRHADYEGRREREIEREREARKRAGRERERGNRERSRSQSPSKSGRKPSGPAGREREASGRSYSPIPENGAGDVLSVQETNKLRAKLGLKPLEVESGPSKVATAATTSESKKSGGDGDLSSYKDEWGEFLHKPADNIKEKKEAEKLREKLKQRKEKRFLEERLARIRTLGESDEETDNVTKWVDKNKRVVNEREEAKKKAKELEELDEAFGIADIVEQEKLKARQRAYGDNNLKGLCVEHDMDDFGEGRTVILTLKDQDVLNEEEGDTLVNVNMLDDERYKKNVVNKKQNPLSYGYNVYEEQYDELGNPIERSVLEKYDEDLEGQPKKRKNFVIGENSEEDREHRRRLLEIKTKLAGKRLETLEDTNLQLASDTFSVEELAKFKKPKKKVKKIRQKLKAEDLEPLPEAGTSNFGSRHGRHREPEDVEMKEETKPEVKYEAEEDDDLERVLSKARKLKQKDNLIKKPLPIGFESIQRDIKPEIIDEASSGVVLSSVDGHIVLNATAEFCRTLGDIPTYGMAGNRNEDSNDMMDFDKIEQLDDNMDAHNDEPALSHGTWNSVNPDEVMQPADLDNLGDDLEDRAILDEEPDVGAGVANALRLALSKGYLEREEKNRPSNTKMAHLQAKNYSIEDKAAGEDEKVGRRDRFHCGPIMDFKDKETFKPNVKLDYIDDNGRILNLKEAFRYLSHKFHGKGPGKNKIEKRLKKMEQDGLMKTMSSTDTPLGTLTMLQHKQKETKTAYVVLSGNSKNAAGVSGSSIAKFK